MLFQLIHSDLFMLHFQVRKFGSRNNALSLFKHSGVPKPSSYSSVTPIPNLHILLVRTSKHKADGEYALPVVKALLRQSGLPSCGEIHSLQLIKFGENYKATASYLT